MALAFAIIWKSSLGCFVWAIASIFLMLPYSTRGRLCGYLGHAYARFDRIQSLKYSIWYRV